MYPWFIRIFMHPQHRLLLVMQVKWTFLKSIHPWFHIMNHCFADSCLNRTEVMFNLMVRRVRGEVGSPTYFSLCFFFKLSSLIMSLIYRVRIDSDVWTIELNVDNLVTFLTRDRSLRVRLWLYTCCVQGVSSLFDLWSGSRRPGKEIWCKCFMWEPVHKLPTDHQQHTPHFEFAAFSSLSLSSPLHPSIHPSYVHTFYHLTCTMSAVVTWFFSHTCLFPS